MKVLLFGLGSIGQRHAGNLRRLLGDNVELLAFRQRGRADVITPKLTVKTGAVIESEYGIRSFADLNAALAQKPDVAFITNPNHLHVESALAAAKAGCHLFIEKPVGSSLEGLEALRNIVKAKKLICLVAYQLRFHPALEIMKRLIAEGAIGRVIAGRQAFGEYMPGWHPYEDYRGYHAASREQGGGVLLSQIHDIDFLYALFGMPSRVCCFGGKLSDLEIDVEDTASMLLDFSSPHGGSFPVHLHQDYSQSPAQRICEVIGTQGKLVWDYFAADLKVIGSNKKIETFSFESLHRNQLFTDEILHFLDCLRGNATPCVDLDAGIASLKIALAARESLETRSIVSLQES